MTIKHTRGPWGVAKKSPRGFPPETIVAELEDLWIIAPNDPPDDFTDHDAANANLIAAAPELLEACRIVTRFLDGLEDPIEDRSLTEIRQRVHAPLRAALNPAIAKAEGRS